MTITLTPEQERIIQAQIAAERIRELREGITLDRPKGMSLREYAHTGHKH